MPSKSNNRVPSDSNRNNGTDGQHHRQSRDYQQPPSDKKPTVKTTTSFIPHDNIHPDLIGPWAAKNLGPEAIVKPSAENGQEGYLVTSKQIPTEELLRLLITESKKRVKSETRNASTKPQGRGDLGRRSRVSADVLPDTEAQKARVGNSRSKSPEAGVGRKTRSAAAREFVQESEAQGRYNSSRQG